LYAKGLQSAEADKKGGNRASTTARWPQGELVKILVLHLIFTQCLNYEKGVHIFVLVSAFCTEHARFFFSLRRTTSH